MIISFGFIQRELLFAQIEYNDTCSRSRSRSATETLESSLTFNSTLKPVLDFFFFFAAALPLALSPCNTPSRSTHTYIYILRMTTTLSCLFVGMGLHAFKWAPDGRMDALQHAQVVPYSQVRKHVFGRVGGRVGVNRVICRMSDCEFDDDDDRYVFACRK